MTPRYPVVPDARLGASGLLSGTPTAAGTLTFTATASSGGQNGSGTVNVVVTR